MKSNLDDPKMVAGAIVGIVRKYNVAALVVKSLEPKPYTDMTIPERWMQDLLERMRQQYGKDCLNLYRNISRWLDIKLGIRKSMTIPPHLTPDDVEELREIVRSHFGMSIGDDVLELFDKYGLTPSDMGWMVTAYQEAFLLGRISPDIDIPLDVLRREMGRRPRTRLDELATERGQANMRLYLRKIGDVTANDVGQTVSAHEARQISGVINRYLRGDLRQTEASDIGVIQLTDDERAGIESERWVTSEQQLRTEMYHYFKNDPANRDRDWWRTAVTETRAAANTGRLIETLENDFDKTYFWVQHDACLDCKRAYLNPDGTPKIFSTADLAKRAVETSGINVGSEERGQPNAVLHPHCNCIPMTYIEGVELPRHPNPRGKPPRRRRG